MNRGLKNSRAQEKGVAKRYGGKVNPGSGNGWVHKNDVRNNAYSFECKTTEKNQFTLRLSDLINAEKHAVLSGREMVFVVEIGGRNWMVITEPLFESLQDD